MKRLLSILAAALLAAQLFAAGGYAAAKEEITDGRAYLTKVYHEMDALQSFRGEGNITVKTPVVNLSAVIVMDTYQPDKLLKIAADCKLAMPDGTTKEMQITQYMQETADEILLYSNIDKDWVKSSIKQNKPEQMDIAETMQFVKTVVVKKQDANMVTLDAVMDMEKVGDLIQTVFGQMLEQPAEAKVKIGKQPADAEQKAKKAVVAAMKCMGDVSYVITIDKTTNRIANIEIDLTEAVRKSAHAVAGQMGLQEQHEAMFTLFLQNIEVRIREDFSLFNQVKPIVIPQEVLKNAIDEATARKKMKTASGVSAIGIIDGADKEKP